MNCPITNMPRAGITTRGDYDWFRLGGGKSFCVTKSAQAVALDPANADALKAEHNRVIKALITFRGPGYPIVETSNAPGRLFRVTTKL